MNWSLFTTSAISMGLLGAFFAGILALASTKFAVEVDSRVEEIEDILPGANCGACGLPGCSNLAEAIVSGKAGINDCPVGGGEISDQIAEIMGLEAAAATDREVACLRCAGGKEKASSSSNYAGIKSCRAADNTTVGTIDCQYGCLGLGDCLEVCSFGALEMDDGLPRVDEDLCTACGRCIEECPRQLFILQPEGQQTLVRCKAPYKGKKSREICSVGCIGCGLCQRICPVEAIEVENNLAVIDEEKCVNCGLCADKCPTDSISFTGQLIDTIRITEDCIGCTLCRRKCPVEAISGEKKEQHQIDEEKCIGCGICYDLCRKDAIEVTYL